MFLKTSFSKISYLEKRHTIIDTSYIKKKKIRNDIEV